MLEELNIEGIVTNVNQKLLQFILNKEIYVYICTSFNKKDTRLPKLGEHVKIQKGNLNKNPFGFKTIVLCENSVANFNSLEDVTNILTTDAMFSKYAFGIDDFKQIDIFYNKINKSFASMESLIIRQEEVTLKLICSLLKKFPQSSDIHNPSTKLLSRFSLSSISDCIYVDVRTEKPAEELSYWSFGAHYLEENYEFIIGHLYIEMHRYGMLMIKDDQCRIPLFVINNRSNKDLCYFIESLVLIRKCTIISEIYKDHKVDNFEYIVVEFDDMEVLIGGLFDSLYFKKAYSSDESLSSTYQNWITLTVLSKSTTIYSFKDTSERWVEVSMHFMDNENSLLCFKSKDFQVSAVLTVGTRYKLCYNGKLKCSTNQELQRFFPHHTLYEIPDIYAFYKIQTDMMEKEEIMSVKQCKEYITKNPTGMISFKGKVKFKKFNEPLSSRTQRKIPFYGFGTPGLKTHVIDFEVEGDKVKTLTLYLNNWESMLMPFGLIPDMHVIVRNVAQQKSKYLKSTAMTSFELLSYKPQVRFESVNLYSKTTGDIWGKPYYLGLGQGIPYGVIIWCQIYSVFIKTLKIYYLCNVCERFCSNTAECCNSKPILGTTIVMIVTDDTGEAKVISKSPDLLPLLFDFRPHQYNAWLEVFRSIGLFEYSSYECWSPEDEDFDSEALDGINKNNPEEMFRYAMMRLIKSINEIEFNTLQLFCKKMNSKIGEEEDPVWFCLKARKCDRFGMRRRFNNKDYGDLLVLSSKAIS